MTSDFLFKKRIKRLLYLLMGAGAVVLIAFYTFNRITSKDPVYEDVKVDSKALAALGKMQQTSIRNGIKEWTLDATRATILKKENRALLEDVSVHFFPVDGGEIHLTSLAGTIDLTTRDMTLTDTVVVRRQDQRLETDRLHYEKKRHIIYSKNSVVLTAPRARISADSMTLDLNQNRVRLTGRVNANFIPSAPGPTQKGRMDLEP